MGDFELGALEVGDGALEGHGVFGVGVGELGVVEEDGYGEAAAEVVGAAGEGDAEEGGGFDGAVGDEGLDEGGGVEALDRLVWGEEREMGDLRSCPSMSRGLRYLVFRLLLRGRGVFPCWRGRCGRGSCGGGLGGCTLRKLLEVVLQ